MANARLFFTLTKELLIDIFRLFLNLATETHLFEIIAWYPSVRSG